MTSLLTVFDLCGRFWRTIAQAGSAGLIAFVMPLIFLPTILIAPQSLPLFALFALLLLVVAIGLSGLFILRVKRASALYQSGAIHRLDAIWAMASAQATFLRFHALFWGGVFVAAASGGIYLLGATFAAYCIVGGFLGVGFAHLLPIIKFERTTFWVVSSKQRRIPVKGLLRGIPYALSPVCRLRSDIRDDEARLSAVLAIFGEEDAQADGVALRVKDFGNWPGLSFVRETALRLRASIAVFAYGAVSGLLVFGLMGGIFGSDVSSLWTSSPVLVAGQQNPDDKGARNLGKGPDTSDRTDSDAAQTQGARQMNSSQNKANGQNASQSGKGAASGASQSTGPSNGQSQNTTRGDQAGDVGAESSEAGGAAANASNRASGDDGKSPDQGQSPDGSQPQPQSQVPQDNSGGETGDPSNPSSGSASGQQDPADESGQSGEGQTPASDGSDGKEDGAQGAVSQAMKQGQGEEADQQGETNASGDASKKMGKSPTNPQDKGGSEEEGGADQAGGTSSSTTGVIQKQTEPPKQLIEFAVEANGKAEQFKKVTEKTGVQFAARGAKPVQHHHIVVTSESRKNSNPIQPHKPKQILPYWMKSIVGPQQ